jgi:hypothetical protein
MNFKTNIHTGTIQITTNLRKGKTYGDDQQVIWLEVGDITISHIDLSLYRLRFDFYDNDTKFYTIVER